MTGTTETSSVIMAELTYMKTTTVAVFPISLMITSNGTIEVYPVTSTDDPGFDLFLSAYCLEPPTDSCSFPGRCPNPDAAGIFVRIAAYIANIALGLNIFFAPDDGDVVESFWSHVIFMYAQYITVLVSIFQHNITRFHASIAALQLAGSPLTFCLIIYAYKSGFRHKNRLSVVMGPIPGKRWGPVIARWSIYLAMALWSTVESFSFLPENSWLFSQPACDTVSNVSAPIMSLIFIPYAAVPLAFTSVLHSEGLGTALIVLLPAAPIFVAWIICLYRARHELSTRSGRWKQFKAVWTVVSERYPFVHFCGIFVVPIIYWIWIIESRTLESNDNRFDASFGQILALAMALQPLVSLMRLAGQLKLWLKSLHVSQLITKRGLKNDKETLVTLPMTQLDISTDDSHVDVQKSPLLERSY